MQYFQKSVQLKTQSEDFVIQNVSNFLSELILHMMWIISFSCNSSRCVDFLLRQILALVLKEVLL